MIFWRRRLLLPYTSPVLEKGDGECARPAKVHIPRRKAVFAAGLLAFITLASLQYAPRDPQNIDHEGFLQSLLHPGPPDDPIEFLNERRILNSRRELQMTNILNHAPGYTVFENLYWRNYSFYIITDQHTTVPHLRRTITWEAADAWVPEGPDGVVKLFTVQGPKHSEADINEHEIPGTIISYEAAAAMTKSAESLGGLMWLNNDAHFVDHYYHLFAESMLASLKVWHNFWWREGFKSVPAFQTISFMHMHSREEMDEEGTPARRATWEDSYGINSRMMDLMYPGTKMESRRDWDARAATNKMYRLPFVLFADREGGSWGPQSGYKPWGDALRLYTPPDFLSRIRNSFLGHEPAVADKPKVVYLSRQGTGRRLSDGAHQSLMSGLRQLEDEGLCTFEVETFGKLRQDTTIDYEGFIPLEEQIDLISQADILVAVHGNGLSHAMWMKPGSTIFEFQPKGCTVNDFGPVAMAASVNHYIIHEDEKCSRLDCPGRGCSEGVEINGGIFKLDVPYLVKEVRLELRSQSEILQQAESRRSEMS